jgi:anaerobic selenocysteine-containing dehydrogenase
MKQLFTILFSILLLTVKAQFPSANTGCYTYEYVPTKADTVTEIIPAVTQIIPAVYKDTVITKVLRPEFTEQYIDCSNNQIKICNRTVFAIKQCVKQSYLVKPEQVIIVIPAYSIKSILNIRPGFVMQVPCK